MAIKNNGHDNKYRYVTTESNGEARVNSEQVGSDQTWEVTFIGSNKVTSYNTRSNDH